MSALFAPAVLPCGAKTVKEVVDASSDGKHLTSIPSSYAFYDPIGNQIDDSLSDSITTIDYSLLMSSDPKKRSQAVKDLAQACEEWGFFILVNHGVSEDMFKGMMQKSVEFFDLPTEEKQKYAGKDAFDTIRCGTSFNPTVEKVHLWRDYVKCFVHPQFYFPDKPQGFSDLAHEFIGRVREVSKALLGGLSESLGLPVSYLEKAMDVANGFSTFSVNYYPPCPQPELAAGLSPHSDYGFMTLVFQNDIDGLELKHKSGKWVPVHAPPNSFLVNVADQLEVMTNGRCKSYIHRAVPNSKTTRISIVVLNGPSLDCVVKPADDLVHDGSPPGYMPMKYRDYIEHLQRQPLKSNLDRVRLLNKATCPLADDNKPAATMGSGA